jgi:hypothetical protein
MKIEKIRESASYLLEGVEDIKEYKVKDVTFFFSKQDTDYGLLHYKSPSFYGDCKVYFDNGGAYGFTKDISKDMLEKLYDIVTDKNAEPYKLRRDIDKLLEIGNK